MLQFLGLLLTILLSICTVSRALPDLHKRMSAQQLQSVFHVDSLAAVPHYEVVQLLHHHEAAARGAAADEPTLQRRRRRRSINVVSATSGATKESHHVKKDLSKNPYYSELKMAAASMKNGIQSVDSTKASQSSFNAKDVRDIKEHNVSFQAFGENLNLTLRATQGLFKEGPHKLRMWTVSGEPNATHGIEMQEVLDENSQSSEEIGELFQDEANMAAILMRRHLETGDLIMEGSIGHEMVIKPLPHELSPHRDQTHHIVYKRETSSSDHLGDFAFMEPDDLVSSEQLQRLQKRSRRSVTLAEQTDELQVAAEIKEAADSGVTHQRSKRTAPYIIYPEVLVIVDYDGYRLHGGDNLQVKRYFISFWNGVDLRYRLLKGPRIRISIAGIIISRGRDATPYLERNRVGRDAIDSAAALTDMGKYLFRERRLPVYDIAVAITKLDMCRRSTAFGECNRGTAGFAYVGGACVVNKRLEKVNSVAIIEDTGGFSGIIVAAHEVGHLLGAVHDGSPPPSYLGGPGAQRCRWEDGYIMSDLRHTERGFRWSPCTVQSFHHFLNGDTATCLHNAPHEDGALGRSLPGTLLSLDAQCRRDRGTYACFKDQRVCAQLFCFDAQTGYCVAYRPAAEGSPCGNGMQCLDGRCQALASNVIPDYEKQYRVVYNRADEADDSDEEDDDGDADEDDDDGDDGDDDDSDNDDGNHNSEDNQPREDVEENSIKSSDKEKQISEEGKIVSKFDNTVEETLLEVTDNRKEGPPPTTAKSDTNNTVTPPTTTPPTPPSNVYTLKYLARFLDSTKMWQHFIRGLSATQHKQPTPAPAPTPLDEQIPRKPHNIITKTSTSISISSRSSTKNSSRSSSSSSENETQKQKHVQHTPTEQHITEQKQQQQPKQHNILRLHPTEFHKQFPKISSNFYLNPNNNQSQQRTNQQQSPQTHTSTYSSTDNQDGINNNAGGTEDDESNEAIERQNRNPEVTITTSVQQNPKQQQQQQLSTATTPTKSYGGGGGGRSTPPRYHTFFDAYFKKLQAVNGPLNQQEPRSEPLTTITTSVSSTTSTTSSTSSSSTAQRKPAAPPNSYENFGAHFLKRTLSSSKTSGSSNSSSDKISSSSSNNSTQTHDSATTPATSVQPAYVTNYIGDNSNNWPAVSVNVKQQEEGKQLEEAQQPSQQQQRQQQQMKIHKFTRRQLIRTQIK